MDFENLKLEDLQLIHFADPIMSTKPNPFDFEKDGKYAEKLANLLFEKMFELGGVGLSANQVGLPYRVFVFGNKETRTAVFNPQIVGVSPKNVVIEEGCLSFPGFTLSLSRPEALSMTYQDVKGEYVTSQYASYGARVILHEYDHMEGINFTFHASNFKLKWELKKWEKKNKKNLRKMINGRQRV